MSGVLPNYQALKLHPIEMDRHFRDGRHEIPCPLAGSPKGQNSAVAMDVASLA